MMSTTAAIRINNLYKKYKNGKTTLENINLVVPTGAFYGLLGPNGAGKSTLINIIAGNVVKTSGEVKICDIDISKNFLESRKKIGIVPQEIFIDTFFNVYETLQNVSGYYGIPEKDRNIEEILENLGLIDKAYVSPAELSGGMKRRLLIAKALMHNPDIIILDEPTAGVDVELRETMWAYMRKLNEQGKTIVITTHYLEEVEQLCSHVGIINKGKLIVNEEKNQLMKKFGNKIIKITTDNVIENIPKKFKISTSKNNIYNLEPLNNDDINDFLNLLQANEIKILDIETLSTTIEDIFKTIIHNN